MVARVGRAQLHAQYSWMCHGVWSGKNSWYWMAREQAWPPTEHSSYVEVDFPRPAVRRHLANGLDVERVHDAGGARARAGEEDEQAGHVLSLLKDYCEKMTNLEPGAGLYRSGVTLWTVVNANLLSKS